PAPRSASSSRGWAPNGTAGSVDGGDIDDAGGVSHSVPDRGIADVQKADGIDFVDWHLPQGVERTEEHAIDEHFRLRRRVQEDARLTTVGEEGRSQDRNRGVHVAIVVFAQLLGGDRAHLAGRRDGSPGRARAMRAAGRYR